MEGSGGARRQAVSDSVLDHRTTLVAGWRDPNTWNGDALVCRHRVRLASRAKRGEPAILRKQPLAMPDEALPVRRKISLEWC